MRQLSSEEMRFVSGGEGETCTECEGGEEGRRKNNNGYGNGAESGPPPGNSGRNNPQLIEWNRGPRGVR